jgi:glycosyltransferase involved in cell wall biosynthesis
MPRLVDVTGKSGPEVAVALCTRNGEAYIAEQLRSILTQSYQPRQLVLSDDASTDGTLALATSIVEEFNAAHPASPLELVVIRNHAALGIAANFAQAIETCTCELIALSDQDDVWAPDRLERVVAQFVSRPKLTLLHSDARLVDAEGAPLGHSLFETLGVTPRERKSIAAGKAMKVLVRRNLVTGATTVFRRELVEKAMPIPIGWIHDEWLGIMAAALGLVDADPHQLVDYRQHGNNQIGAKRLGLKGKINKLREPRSERNRNLYIRSRELVTRLESFGTEVAALPLRLAWEKQEHERYRVSLPTSRLRRVLPVLATAVRGNYRRYGLGGQDVLRDLVQAVD